MDKAEWLVQGYDEKFVEVTSGNGPSEQALIYVATNIDTSLLPYSWYLKHVIVGAKETELPTECLDNLK